MLSSGLQRTRRGSGVGRSQGCQQGGRPQKNILLVAWLPGVFAENQLRVSSVTAFRRRRDAAALGACKFLIIFAIYQRLI